MRLWLLTLAFFVTASAAAQAVFVNISSPLVVDPGLPFQYTINYTLTSIDDAPGFIDVELPPGFAFKSGKHCGPTSSVVQCSAFSGSDRFVIEAIAPDILEGATFTTRATITILSSSRNTTSSRCSTTLVRTFVVDHTNDAGTGSLRAAIESSNARCIDGFPCTIAFRLGTPPSSGYHTIAPLTPLPVVTGQQLVIDGTTQTRSTAGDTNPDGPEIFIDGSNAAIGDAITIGGCAIGVTGLAIGNFRGSGVHALTTDCPRGVVYSNSVVYSNYLGVDPSGLRAAPNDRGVVVNQAKVDITSNLISGNRRSGVFLVFRPPDPIAFDQSSSPMIRGNTIGLDRKHQPLGNGASGVYVEGSAVLRDNYVTFNHDFGVAIANSSLQSAVDIQVNSIFANGQMGIDIGLDGLPPDHSPTIRSARYDPTTNRTLIDIAVGARGGNISPNLTIYASDAPHTSGYGDGQYLLGDVNGFPFGEFVTFSAIGDWRGKWVSATQTDRTAFEQFYVPIARTSEFSRAVKVE
jgi:hypothetical protein